MQLTLIAVTCVISIVVVAAFARQIGVASPLILVVAGGAMSLLPSIPDFQVEPEWILAGVLPPLLYAAAVHIPAQDFRRDFKAIAGLAVLLVAVTTLCSGLMFSILLPGLGLAAAFALGAVISPTDAVAATAVGKRLGLPSRLLTILEGEGLVNDASALVLLSSAVAAMGATVHPLHVGGEFVYSVACAVLVGVVVGIVNVRVRALLNDNVLNTAISFVVPFLAFVPAEELHASGVLAVVVTGLVTGHLSPRFLRATDRLTEATNWATVAFLLEGGVFLLMGLQVKTVLDEVSEAGLSVREAVWIGLLAAVLVIAMRMLFVAPLVASLRRDANRAETMTPVLERMEARANDPDVDQRFTEKRQQRFLDRIVRKRGDIKFAVAENFGWRGGVVLAWSGMRGAITLAAAQSLPTSTPYRAELLLIAFVVAISTLLVQGLSLPFVIRAVRVPGDDITRDREEFAELHAELTARAEIVLDDPALALPDGSAFSDDVVKLVRDELRTRTVTPEDGEFDSLLDTREQYRLLRLDVLAAQQSELLDARSMGLYGSRTLTRFQRALDIEGARLQQLPGPGD
ncbi:cation:proton antiporter [Nocardia jejuensis]|uniref:cation:proton antiporter n=1 Tax=Nocardia jejuensis TaxID=328049 RepID=UPI00082C83FB|nr:cation:proton antiporter [Nocardia jejuensis]